MGLQNVQMPLQPLLASTGPLVQRAPCAVEAPEPSKIFMQGSEAENSFNWGVGVVVHTTRLKLVHVYCTQMNKFS